MISASQLRIASPGPRPLLIGALSLDGRVLLAPMSGVTDVVLRGIVRRLGASAVVSEMVACESYLRGDAETLLRAEGEGVSPHIVQLAGRDPGWMAEAARVAAGAGAAVIDINMGCPAKRVIGGHAGAALMRDLDLAARIIGAVVAASPVPVTLKMRLGWDRQTLNAPALARRAEALGVAMVTVHGRTRDQFYQGGADWTAVRAVRDAISAPLVVNGDITTLREARAALELSGADAVMVGRAAIGRPWLPGEIAAGLAGAPPRQLTACECGDIAVEHHQGLLRRFGRTAGVRHARKHVSAYLEHAGAEPGLRRQALTSDCPDEVSRLLRRGFQAAPARKAVA